MAMKMFMNMKLSMMKDLAERIEKENLMTDDLRTFFDKEFDEIKDSGKMMCKSMNKLNKKRSNSSSTSSESDESDETTGSNKKMKKEKRAPTEHQSRVSKCMVVLKERFGQVKHQIRLGTANYMATFIKTEFTDIDFDTDKEKVEQALHESIKRMNEKKGTDVYPVVHSETSDCSDKKDDKKDDKKSVTNEPSTSSSSKTNKKKSASKKSEKKSEKKIAEESDDDDEEDIDEKKKSKELKMNDLLKELEEMNNDDDESDESDEDDE